MKNTMKKLIAIALVLLMVFALTACGDKDADTKKDPAQTEATDSPKTEGSVSAKDYDTEGFDGVFTIGEKGNLCISYPTSLLQEDGYGNLERISGDAFFISSIYVYPEGSSSIEGSNSNMSNNLKNEKEFQDDLDYTVGSFSCHHVRYVNIWDQATHCYLIDTTSLGDKDAAAVYIKFELQSDDQLPTAEAIISTLRLADK